jgi:hypothetical protein
LVNQEGVNVDRNKIDDLLGLEDNEDDGVEVEIEGALVIPNDSVIEIGSEKIKGGLIQDRLEPDSSLHAEVLANIMDRRENSRRHIEDRRDQWKDTSNKLRMYVDLSSDAKQGDNTYDYGVKEMPFNRSIVVPASASILQVLQTQLMSIFAATDPLVQIKPRGPEDTKPSQIMESVLAYDLDEMRAFLVLYSLCQDSLKFGLGITYDSWHTEYGTRIDRKPFDPTSLEDRVKLNVLGSEAFIERTWGPIKEHNLWQGVNPMTYLPDPKVPVYDVQNSEYVGHEFHRGITFLKERSWENGGPYFNIDKISGGAEEGEFTEDKTDDSMPDLDPSEVDDRDGGSIRLTHMQVKLCPKEWDLGESESPEIWWFTVANKTTIVRAHPNPYDHKEFTYAVAESDPDFHSSFNPGVIESIDGLQRIMDWMFNSHISNLMKHLNDAMIFSPTLVEEYDITHPGPGRHIRLTQMGEELIMQGGYQIGNFIHQLPVQDVTSPHLNAVNTMFQLAQRLTAANDPQMGMPTPDRKTLGEIQTINANASQRISMVAKLIDAMAISKLANRAISNRLQLTTMEQYYRIRGNYAGMDPDVQHIMASRDDLYGNFDYKYNTGILPPDPIRMSRTWAQVLETLSRTIPMIQQQAQMGIMPPDGKIPNINEALKETVMSMGVKDIDRFYVPLQVQQDQQVEQGVQAGNMVPLNEIDPNNPPPEMMQ